MSANPNAIEILAEILAELRAIHNLLEQQPAPAPASDTAAATAAHTTMEASTLVMTFDDQGNPAYRLKGGQYSKFGVRVWPEVLPVLGINPSSLKPGPNSLPAGLTVRISSDPDKPMKVVGLA